MGKRKLTIILSAAAVLVIAATLAVVLPLALAGGREQSVSQTAQSFVNLVMRIRTPITLDSEAEIEAGYILYESLGEADRENGAVKANKELLDRYNESYGALRAAKDEEEEQAAQAVLTERFSNAVAALPATGSLTSGDREAVNAALALYGLLNDRSKEQPSVVAAYALLAEAERKVAQIEYNEKTEAVNAAAEEFIGGVRAIGSVTLDSINAIEDLLYDYERFSDEVKSVAGVSSAKETLDAAMAEYLILKDDDDVSSFKAYAAELSPVETAVTLESDRTIANAESLYGEMSERAKGAEGVAAAYETVAAARAKYNELFAVAEAERIRAFVDAANAVPEDVESVDIGWFDVLDRAGSAYRALTYESQLLPEVEEAFARWERAQKVFDEKGYERIPMTDPNVLFSGHAVNPLLVLQNENNMLSPLKEFYGVSSVSGLSEYVTVWLNVYVDGEYVGRGELPASVLGHEIAASYIQSILRDLSADHENVVSGGSFAFSIHLEDKKNEYIPSTKTKVSAAKIYTW